MSETWAHAAQNDLTDAAQSEISRDAIRLHLIAAYRAANPSKVSHVDVLLDMYAGQELRVYYAVCRKYGLVPMINPAFDDTEDRAIDSDQPRYVAATATAPMAPASSASPPASAAAVEPPALAREDSST